MNKKSYIPLLIVGLLVSMWFTTAGGCGDNIGGPGGLTYYDLPVTYRNTSSTSVDFENNLDPAHDATVQPHYMHDNIVHYGLGEGDTSRGITFDIFDPAANKVLQSQGFTINPNMTNVTVTWDGLNITIVSTPRKPIKSP